MRFVAPARQAVDPARFAHPAFGSLRGHRDLLAAREWPALDALNERLGLRCHPRSGAPLRFVAQTRELLHDGMHYETRICHRGEIATRTNEWHDLINALVWIEHTELKAALNARQAADVEQVGSARRTRAQCALTHFDEAGAIVLLRDRALLDPWDAHDWPTLLGTRRAAWLSDDRSCDATLIVFGHALLEHLLVPRALPAARCIALWSREPDDGVETRVADAIASGDLLRDPQELRPLPLAGIPGWDDRTADARFLREAPCFRPLRAGRTYPAPIPL